MRIKFGIVYLLLCSTVVFVSCNQAGSNPVVNNPPWPVTGPALTTPLSLGNTSFQLEINGQFTTKDNFDPDGDDVTFTITNEQLISGSVAPPTVNVDSDGFFHVFWPSPDTLTGTFATIRYTITTSDDIATTQPTKPIDVQYK